MAVPKQKRSKSRTRTQHTHWRKLQAKRLVNSVNIVSCSHCSERIPERTVCPVCGHYKGVLVKKTLAPSTPVIQA